MGCEEYRPSEHPAQSHTLSAHHHNEHSGQFLHHNSVRHGKVYYSGQCNQTLHQTYAVPKNEHKPVITELYAFLTESMKKRTLVRIFVVLLKKSNFYGTIYILTL